MSVHSHYDTLKVTRDAPREVIIAAYKAMAQKYHPDKNRDNPEAMQLMQIINAAYKILSDPVMRSEHDTWINRQDPPPPKAPPTPAEREAQTKINAATEEAAKWSYWAEKAGKEAEAAKDKAMKAAAKAELVSASEKDKWRAVAAQAAAEAAAAEREAAKAAAAAQEKQKECNAIVAKYGAKDAKASTTHYETLSVTQGAPVEVIQAAYRALTQKHPAGSATIRIIELAYATLGDPAKKADYDNEIRKTAPPSTLKGLRKPSARELETQAVAKKTAEEAAQWTALAARDAAHEKEAQKKAAEAAQNAVAKAKDKDAAAWKTWADKLAAEAAQERRKAEQTAAKASEMKEKAEKAAAEAKEATSVAEKEHAMWATDGTI